MTTSWMPFIWGLLTKAEIISLRNNLLLTFRLYHCVFLVWWVIVTLASLKCKTLRGLRGFEEGSEGFRYIIIPILCFVYSVCFSYSRCRLFDFQLYRIADCWKSLLNKMKHGNGFFKLHGGKYVIDLPTLLNRKM